MRFYYLYKRCDSAFIYYVENKQRNNTKEWKNYDRQMNGFLYHVIKRLDGLNCMQIGVLLSLIVTL